MALFNARVTAGAFANQKPLAKYDFSGHRVPVSPSFRKNPRAMLPGFRFLFAAVMLSMSLLVFGLGAAALLRAAHESFASNPSWRGSPEVAFAQRPDTTLAMLATLRVEPAAERPLAVEPAPPAIAEPVTSDQVAALQPAEASAVEDTKPVDTPVPMPTAQNSPAPEVALAAPVAAETTVAAIETGTAAVATSEAASGTSEAAIALPQPVPTAAAPIAAAPTVAAPALTAETIAAETRIATLGGPPVDITDGSSALSAEVVVLPRPRPDQADIKRLARARRAAHRRRLAARARLAALQQLQANPFAQPPQPYLQPAATTRQRQ